MVELDLTAFGCDAWAFGWAYMNSTCTFLHFGCNLIGGVFFGDQ